MNLTEPIYKAQINRLAQVLENPASVYSSRNHNGYVCLSGENANWHLCAQVAHKALRGRHHYKATSLVFQIGRAVINAHGWQNRPPPVQRPNELAFRDGEEWIDGIDRRPKQAHEQFIGAYCLSLMILLGWCRLAWSDHKDYECEVVMLSPEDPLSREPTTYTQFKPFEPWWRSTDEHEHELVKTDLGTNWTPSGWHFTGQAPSPIEDRLWHPYQQMRQTGERPTHIAPLTDRPIVYRAQVDPPEWIQAVNKHEAVPYRINKRMLDLMEQLGIVDEDRPEDVSFLDEARRLAEHEKFYQRMHLDFRGRMYTSRSLVNYQNDDEYRCLIEFAEGVELDQEGYLALCFHVANLWELPDHLLPTVEETLPEIDWGDSEDASEGGRDRETPIFFKKVWAGIYSQERFIRYAENPVETYDEWRVNALTGEELSDPLLFIRACMELRDATKGAKESFNKGFITHLPVEVDQSNSVIQHLSLFYGDFNLATMCSLVTEVDFYTRIATDWNSPLVAGLSANQKRKLAKKIVMPRCYGAGNETIAEQELDNLPFLSHLELDEKEELAQQGIDRVEAVVPAIRTYRDEIRDVWTQWGLPVNGEMAWATMSGFEVHFRPVYVDKWKFRVPRSREERTGLDRVQLSARYVSPRLNEMEIKMGLQANFVHSVDASLAHMVVAKAEYPVIAVHDAFACHANNVYDLRISFVQQLVAIHMMGKPLRNFRSDVLGEPRPEGGLAWDETSSETIAILRTIQGDGFLGMIG